MALYALDGTWNWRDLKDATISVRRDTVETNVHRFGEFYGSERTVYLQGVGTKLGLIGKALGGVFGMGARRRLRRMYLALAERYHKGDKHIDVVGFSRGAAMAIHLTNIIARYGVPPKDAQRHLGFKRYDGLGLTFRFPKLTTTGVPAVEIRFLGLWDTVATFGIPIRPFRNRSQHWWIHHIPSNVARSFHAMALDEVRTTFELIRPKVQKDKEDRHYELWFRGVHSNVGGGYPDRGLSDIALAWMMEMYLWTLDIEKQQMGDLSKDFAYALRMIGPERLPVPKEWESTDLETLEPDPDGELGLPAAVKRSAWRSLPEGAEVHHTAFLRKSNLVLDHYRANRRLLRRIPRDAFPKYDPPFFYEETRRQTVERIANEAFGVIPVRAAEWCRLPDGGCPYPVRSDQWVALAPSLESKRKELVANYSKKTFLAVAIAWLEAGKPDALGGVHEELSDARGKPIQKDKAVTQIVEVLRFLEDRVPNLRKHRPTQPSAGPAGTVVGA